MSVKPISSDSNMLCQYPDQDVYPFSLCTAVVLQYIQEKVAVVLQYIQEKVGLQCTTDCG